MDVSNMNLPAMGNNLIGTIWDLWKQKREWQREDTAYSRAIADMRSAGVSPVLFSGRAAASSASSIPSSAQKRASSAALMSAFAQIGLVNAQKSLINAQSRKTTAEARHMETLNPMIEELKDIDVRRARWTEEWKTRAEVAAHSIMINREIVSAIDRNIKQKYGMNWADFQNEINRIARDIQRETGMGIAKSEMIAKALAVTLDMTDASAKTSMGLYPGQEWEGVFGKQIMKPLMDLLYMLRSKESKTIDTGTGVFNK